MGEARLAGRVEMPRLSLRDMIKVVIAKHEVLKQSNKINIVIVSEAKQSRTMNSSMLKQSTQARF